MSAHLPIYGFDSMASLDCLVKEWPGDPGSHNHRLCGERFRSKITLSESSGRAGLQGLLAASVSTSGIGQIPSQDG